MHIVGSVQSSFVVVALVALSSSASAERLVDAREVARGDFLAPQFSPDGRELLVTASQMRGLYVLAGSNVRTVTTDDEAGVNARWDADGITFRALRGGTRSDFAVGRDKTIRGIAPKTPLAFTHDDRMYVVDRGGKTTRIGSGDRFFGAVVAPDGDKVVFQGLTTGLYLYVRSSGVLRYIGPGTAPSWSPDSTRLAYEVTEDDGHVIVASDIYLYTVATDRAAPITASDKVVERRPSFAPSGIEIAFDDNTGGIFVGRVEAK